MKYHLYYISEPAYLHLIDLAIKHNYVAKNYVRTHGLSRFLNILSAQTFTDTRPLHVVERHDMEIAYLRAPSWTNFEPRIPRNLKLLEVTQERYVELAFKVGIIENNPWTIGGPRRIYLPSIIGCVLEGIGLGWITPKEIPVYNPVEKVS